MKIAENTQITTNSFRVNAIILAAGKGTRMKAPADKNKVTFDLHGHPLVWWTRRRLTDAGIESAIAVVGYTAASVKAALSFIPMDTDTLLVLYGDDSAFYTKLLLQNIITSHESSEADLTLFTIHRNDPTGLGRIIRNRTGAVIGIVEEKNASRQQHLLKEVNAGLYCFKKSFLLDAINKIIPNPITHEYDLTDLLSIAVEMGAKINSYTIDNSHVWFGVNTAEQLGRAQDEFVLNGQNQI